ncbi:hypothetical protein [Sinorhizobium meliloti]|uniref:hypothetical protein n=1 Tax=Rhizobium meliloti TaxID=382 RepID=UPI000FD77E26|nr:hypothetical protein [Sinorhizobium meliloti]RVH97622.1 hypothetical protein CN199_07805 [Sinorhizobium meliloti]RVK82299.1 hypothetical protein CN153_26235 [Sinorhizobium meliloti]RVL18194.1 hypothetical protein CN143_19850 [Sinorhizobium meliloti]RVP39446.1 hypothetical protein CN081_08470 [Sinorhizobium meliloti]
MMTLSAAKGVRDAIVEGSAMLRLPLTRSLLSMIKCGDGPRCKQDRCPVCTSKLTERLLALHRSHAVLGQQWQRSAFALRSYVRAAEDIRPIPIDNIKANINVAIKSWEDAFQREDENDGKNFGCLAAFGLVEDTGSHDRREKVVVVEFVFTDVDPINDFEIFETLRGRFGDEVVSVPLVENDRYCIMPDQGLLFGYTKRRLDQPERPMAISNKRRLARIASNYGDHPMQSRFLSGGLTTSEEGIVFDRTPFGFWLTY